MSFRTKRDEPASPVPGATLAEVQVSVWVIRAGNQNAWKTKFLARHGCKTDRFFRKCSPLRIGRRHQQRALNRKPGHNRPMNDLQASQTVRHENRPRTRFAHSRLQSGHPNFSYRMSPVPFGNPTEFRMRLFPERLPVSRIRSVDSGKSQNSRSHESISRLFLPVSPLPSRPQP